MEKYNKNAKILKIIKLTNLKILSTPIYDCCILKLNSKNDKSYIDIQSNFSYSLKNLIKTKVKKLI